jgi:hypothetical protein
LTGPQAGWHLRKSVSLFAIWEIGLADDFKTRRGRRGNDMSSGLERVARALCELDDNPPDATTDGKWLWENYQPEAWAIIMSLREPDTDMISAATVTAEKIGRTDFAGIYRAMIDAAISN